VQLHQNQRAHAIAYGLLKGAYTPAAHLLRGAALYDAGQSDAALAELRRVPAAAPEIGPAQLRTARILRDAARFDEAVQLLTRALGASPADPDAFTEILAQVHERAGNRAQAQRVLEGALRTRESEALSFALAGLLERSGDVARAVEIARGLLKRSPEHPAALHFIGHTWARSGARLHDAEKLLERAARARPTSGEIAGTLGWVYLLESRLDDAQRTLERAERMAPDDQEVLAHLGDLYLQRDDRAHALAVYHRALAHHPDGNVRHAVEEQLLLLENGRVGAR
jgi:predicted Zn-dependent protease